jgi:cupin fold WbuC family metalloprotein
VPATQLFTPALLDSLAAQASQSPRLRQNLNFHRSPQSPAQRLFNAIEPGSYVVPHRHLQPERDETLVMLRGRLGLILFDDAGTITQTAALAPASNCIGFHLPPEQWHSVVALEPGCVFFEAKDGPYFALQDADRAAWAPAEMSPAAAAYQQQLRALFPA